MSVETGGVEAVVVAIARALSATGQPWFWLDGEGAPEGEARVSYLGVAAEVREALAGQEHAFLSELRESSRAAKPSGQLAGPDAGLAKPGAHTGVAGGDAAESRGGFASGWVVALGYEFGVGLLGLEPCPDDAAPGYALRCDSVIAVSHDSGAIEVRGGGDGSAMTDVVASARAAASSELPGTARRPRPGGGGRETGAWRAADYEAGVEACRAAIRRGDAYVLCLTDLLETETEASALGVYEHLRGGATRGGVIDIGHRQLASASPERFLSVRGSRVETHPIKGTRPRGMTGTSDAALAIQLASDPKERAENLMIVDLLRNDLSRVCAPASVAVDRFLEVETHPRVHQLVSTVSGELRADTDVYDAIAACFPGGSMTGAPKHSAVQILRTIEQGPRGLYAGCFGWIDDSGDAELAMTIRGAELRQGARGGAALARVGAGGGITSDSVPASEKRERDVKAAAVRAIL